MSFIVRNKGIAYCGIVGFSGANNYNIDKIKLLMLWNSVERGKDATGMFSPRTGIIKDSEPAGKFFREKEILKLQEDNTLICHVRAKTVGYNSANNAHPFEYGETILAHNGTLDNYQGPNGLAKRWGLGFKDYDVDSQILALGVSKAFEKEGELNIEILSDYEGAAALLFYNKTTDCLYAYRDALRPLFYGYDIEGNMYISSIKDALEAVEIYGINEFKANNVTTIKDGEILSEKEYKLYDELHPKPARLSKAERKALKREKSRQFPKLEKGQRGIPLADIKTWMCDGFNMRAVRNSRISTYGQGPNVRNFAHITEDNWYTILGFMGEENDPWLQIEDDRGEIAVASVSTFDTTNFIPRDGNLVMFTSNVAGKQTKKRIFSEDEVATVESSNIEEGYCFITSTTTNSKWEIPMDYIRLLTAQELALRLTPVIVDAEIVSESPFISDDENLLVPDEDNPELINFLQKIRDNNSHTEAEDLETPDCIDFDTYESFIEGISDSISILEINYQNKEDITSDINEIKGKINVSLDPAYLNGLKT